MSGIIIGDRCPYCQRFRSPLDFLHQPGGVKICTSCEHRHIEALDALSKGQFTGECSECGLNAEELRDRQKCGPGGEMALHFEGGKYKAMCLICDRTYVPKRAELYGETEFGKTLGLHG